MKVKWGALMVDGRNKIGGQVASKSRSGAYMRNKVTPVNPSAPDQVTVRARLAANSQGWRALTEAQRDAWNAAVNDFKTTDIFGDVQVPSGFNLYVRLNNNLNAINVASISVPPLPTAVSVFTSLTGFTCDTGGNITGTAAPATIPATESVIVRATAPMSAGRNFVRSEFRQIGVLTSITAGAIDISTIYKAKFGTSTPAGTKVFVEFVHVNESTGQTSQAQQVSMIATA